MNAVGNVTNVGQQFQKYIISEKNRKFGKSLMKIVPLQESKIYFDFTVGKNIWQFSEREH